MQHAHAQVGSGGHAPGGGGGSLAAQHAATERGRKWKREVAGIVEGGSFR